MALLSLVEAAKQTGWSVELLEQLAKAGPKHGHKDQSLPSRSIDGDLMFDHKSLVHYVSYLKEPWPRSPRAKRPYIPKAIADDVRAEAHYQCAICGHQDNGELAHLEPVSETMNNSPDNLLLLCPNHHTKFDDIYCLSRNVTLEVALEAKSYKRAARRRILRHEENASRAMSEVLRRVEQLEAKLSAATDPTQALALNTEIRAAMGHVPTLFAEAQAAAARDQPLETASAPLGSTSLMRAVQAVQTGSVTDAELAAVVADVISAGSKYRMPDEVDCPHCAGRGQTGLVGDLCAFCDGNCVVSAVKGRGYDPDEIDEVDCPHCAGRGQTGMVGDVCAFCGGSCVVTDEKSREYDPDEIDEVDCPHCAGRGQTGLVGDVCAFCDGSCVVTDEKARFYARQATE